MFKRILVMLFAVYFVAQMSGLVNYWASGGKQITFVNNLAEEENHGISNLTFFEDLICSEFVLHDISRHFWFNFVGHTYSEPSADLIFLSTFSPPPEQA